MRTVVPFASGPSWRVLACIATASVSLAMAGAAEAQWEPRRSSRQAMPAAFKQEPKVDEGVLSRQPQLPLMAVVSLGEQRITIYDANGRILRSNVSSGQTGYETPVGIFSIIQKNRDHVSNIYEGAAMPFMQRITWSGIALHAGALPGYPASHGCVRLPFKFAENLFDLTSKGMRVVLVRTDMSPVDFSHPNLFTPGPVRAAVAANMPEREGAMRLGATDAAPDATGVTRFDALKAEAEAKAAAAEAAQKRAEELRRVANRLNQDAMKDARFLRGAEFYKSNLEAQIKSLQAQIAASKQPAYTQRLEQTLAGTQKRLEEATARVTAILAQPKVEAAEKAKQEAQAAEDLRKRLTAEAQAAQRKMLPISVLVSRAKQRLYIRQGFEPVMELPVKISEPERPLGTTLFTALGYTKDGSDVRWNALSMYPKGYDATLAAKQPNRRVAARSQEPIQTDAETAKAVLDRIEFPEEARKLISEVVAPGSSLIVTDESLSTETGGGTDNIVVMANEPQGGLKIRPKARPRYDGWGDYDDDRPRRRRSPSYDSWW